MNTELIERMNHHRRIGLVAAWGLVLLAATKDDEFEKEQIVSDAIAILMVASHARC